LSVCEDFAGNDPTQRTIFYIKATSAKPIKDFSKFSSEAESLLLPGTKVKIISKKISPHDGGTHLVEVEEVANVPDGKNRIL
jgi:hypothetical protein